MVDKELLQAIGEMFDEKLRPITQRLDAIEEGQEEIRTSVNVLLEWSERISDTISFPLPRIE